MITSEQGWEKFNTLMNDLRESIASLGKDLVPLYGKLILSPFSLQQSEEIQVVALVHDEEGIEITTEGEFKEETDYILQFEGFEPEDLLETLKQLENIKISEQSKSN